MSSSLIDSVGSLICSTKFSSLKLMKPHEYLLHNLTCEGKREGLGIYNTRKLFASDQEALAPCIPVGTGGAQAVVAFQRSKGEENGFADVWGERLPARMGLWAARAKSSLEKVRGGQVCQMGRAGLADSLVT